jgi:glycosyltransferase involved in cell wall biosynthesis
MIVLHIIPNNKLGGVPVVLRNLIISMPDFHHIIYGEIADEGMSLKFENSEIINGTTRQLKISTILHLYSIINSNNIKLIHSHGKGPGFYSRLLKLFTKTKVVHTFHGFQNRFKFHKRFLYVIYEQLAVFLTYRLIALSNSEKNLIIKSLNFAKKKLRVVPNFYLHSNKPVKRKIGASKFVIGSIGRMCEQKNQKIVIEIAKYFQNTKEIVFVMVGGMALENPNYFDELQTDIRKYGLQNIICYGPVESAASLMSEFNIYLSTSRWEGLPTVILEALDYGIPIVASSCVGNVDLIDDDIGILVDTDDVIGYIRAIESFRNFSNEQLVALRIKQKLFLQYNFSIEGTRKDLTRIYLE